jgi:hypothetical protein
MAGFGTDRSNVAWDIETTGFEESDVITTSGFHYPDGNATLILNTCGATVDADSLQNRLEGQTGVEVDLICTRSEEALIEAMRTEMFERFDREYNRLVAYNGDRWYFKGGFDCPFLRRRCLEHERKWVFRGIVFSDLYEMVQRRINTVRANGGGESEPVDDLVGAHDILCSPESDPDPFDDSAEAVECYENRRFGPLMMHNLADVIKTSQMADALERVVPPGDWRDDKL